MFSTGNRGGSGRTPIIAAVKVLVVWFFLARAILVIGISNKIPENTVWTLDILLFVTTAMYVFVRESIAEGLSGQNVCVRRFAGCRRRWHFLEPAS
jgi:hypothetical protein